MSGPEPDQRRCEHCSCRIREGVYMEHHDEYWCESCADNATEVAYDRQQEANLESPPESSREEHLRTWKEKQELHRR